MRYLLLVLVPGCLSATYHGQTATPIADRAVVLGAHDRVPAQQLGKIEASGGPTASREDLDERAAVIAAKQGGTHLVVEGAGEAVTTTTTPASETQTCSHDDTTNSDTCTTTYTPESTSTYVTPYATYGVLRVPEEQWLALPDALRPTAWDAAHHTASVVDGPGLTIGAFAQTLPVATAGTSGFAFPTMYTRTTPQLGGVWLGRSYVGGSTELALDLRIGGGSYEGMAANTEQGTQAVHYTGTYLGSAFAVRLGERIAIDNFALAAGVGIAGAIWGGITSVDDHGAPIEATFVEPPGGAEADFYLPVWSSITVKTSCNFGLQGLAEYDVRPLDTSTSAPSFGIGLIWQPASACR